MNKSNKFMTRPDYMVVGIILAVLFVFALGDYLQTKNEQKGHYKKEAKYAYAQKPQNCHFNCPRIDEFTLTHGRVLPCT